MLNQEFRPDRLSTARRQGHFTQKALAETVGVSENFLIGMEKGRKRPSMKTAEKLATALRCPISWLFGGDLTGGPTAPSQDQPVVSIMARLALRLCTGIATADEREQLIRLAVQNMDGGTTEPDLLSYERRQEMDSRVSLALMDEFSQDDLIRPNSTI